MKSRLNTTVYESSKPIFELLEDRRLCSTTITLNPAIANQLKATAALAGVNQSILDAALNKASSGKKSDADQANRIIIGAGLGLPADALKTRLNATELAKHAADLAMVGGEEKTNKPDYWKTVKQLGADFALAGAIRESLVIPVTETQGKSPKQLLDDAAQISLLTGNPSSPKAWQGLALLKAHKITVDQFAKQFADGKDVIDSARVVADQAALRGKVRAQINARNAANTTQSQPTNGYNPSTDISTNKNYGNGVAYTHPTNESNQAPAGTDPNGAEYTINDKSTNSDGNVVVSWTMTYDGKTSSYTTVYYAGGWYEVYDSNGGWVGTGEGTPPADDAVGTTTQTTDGDQAIFPSESEHSNTNNDNDKQNQSNDQDGDGIPDDQDDDKDGDGTPDSEQTDAAATTEESTTSSDSQDTSKDTNTAPTTNGTPTPDSNPVDPAARQNWLTSTPFGQAEMKSMLDSIAQAKSGGYGDPENVGVNPVARAAFYASPLFSNQSVKMNTGGGNIDYPDEVQQTAVIDARQLQAITIRTGGAVGGPEAGKKPINTAGQNNPIIPKVPQTGGGTTAILFSTTAIATTVSTRLASTLAVKVSAATVALRK